MFASVATVRARLAFALDERESQGVDVAPLRTTFATLPASLDALASFARDLNTAPRRADWSYDEPFPLEEIEAAADPTRHIGPLENADPSTFANRARNAFLGRVVGCMLGKPFEIAPTRSELRAALEPLGEWPIRDYATRQGVFALREQQGQWPELVRDQIAWVVPDDDLNYTVLAMSLLEEHGTDWTVEQLRDLWLLNLPVRATFGPERTALVAWGLGLLEPSTEFDATALPNPGEELCGALIRVDAYAYATLGDPSFAATLAYRDATITHRGTGVYGAMLIAATIAAAPAVTRPVDALRLGLQYIPQRSRLAESVRDALAIADGATDAWDAATRIEERFVGSGHCMIHHEIGSLAVTLTFATSVDDGVCLQVMQGNDTDSFGATAGSILGACFGPPSAPWIEPLNNDFRTALAMFHERSLNAVADRMASLPARIGAR